MRDAKQHILSIKFAIILRKNRVNVTMAIVLLRHPILVQCCGCHRNKGSMSKTFIHFEEIRSHTYKGEVFLLIYWNYDVVLIRPVLQHTNKRDRR